MKFVIIYTNLTTKTKKWFCLTSPYTGTYISNYYLIYLMIILINSNIVLLFQSVAHNFREQVTTAEC